jgi:hypothetical protein
MFCAKVLTAGVMWSRMPHHSHTQIEQERNFFDFHQRLRQGHGTMVYGKTRTNNKKTMIYCKESVTLGGWHSATAESTTLASKGSAGKDSSSQVLRSCQSHPINKPMLLVRNFFFTYFWILNWNLYYNLGEP